MRALSEAEAVSARACVALVFVVASCAACGGARLAKGPNARPVPDSLAHKLCTGEFGGDGAQIRVWREKDGTFVVFELAPDIAKHSDAPTTFYDDTAREVLRLRSQADAPSSPQALEADRRRDSVTLEGKRAEIIACKGK